GLEGEDGDAGGNYVYPKWIFFLKESNCVYKRILFIKGDSTLIKRQEATLDLTKRDPRLFEFKKVQDTNNNGDPFTAYEVLYDGKVLFETERPLSIERVRRGWSLIYSKYCTGSQAPF